jgi:uncharacterized membrane protein/predicted DsbA family dithiol-disulfide isomerase
MLKRGTVGATGLLASLAPVLSGLAASAALLVDYLRPRPVFCATVGSGCEVVRHSVLAAPAGIPLPVVGVAGFLVIGVTALLPSPPARRVEVFVSGLAGFVGLVLLGAQIHIGHLCPYCCVADASGLLSALISAGRVRWAADAPVPPAATSGGAAALIAAAVGPLVAGFYASSIPVPMPEVIRDQIARTPRGLVTIVDFVDFECPFCRMTHAELAPMVEAHKERIRLVRVQVPLRSHSHALDAAHAACCGERLGKGDAMADALFAAPVDELTPDGCERIAASLGLPMDQYRACVGDPAIAARIEQDRAEFKAAGGYALPTIWIWQRQFVGAQPAEVLAAALHDALSRAGS